MRVISQEDVDALEAALAAELPGFRIAYKDESAGQRAIGRLLRPFNRTYLTQYTTVFGRTVWMPSRAWRDRQSPRSLWALLRHEAVHLRDMRRFPVLFQLSYALLLPAGLTFRALWEARAYRETLRAEAELDGAISEATIEHIAGRFTGPDYLFMFPFPKAIRRHLRRVSAEVLAELRSSAGPETGAP